MDYYNRLKFRRSSSYASRRLSYRAMLSFDNGFRIKVYQVFDVSRGVVGFWVRIFCSQYTASWRIGYPNHKLTVKGINRICAFIESCNGKTPEIYVYWVLESMGKSMGTSTLREGTVEDTERPGEN